MHAKFFPIVAPDGRTIFYIGKGITYTDVVGGRLNLFVRDLASGTSRQLTSFTDDNVVAFAWSRDGSRIAMLRGNQSTDVVMIAAKQRLNVPRRSRTAP